MLTTRLRSPSTTERGSRRAIWTACRGLVGPRTPGNRSLAMSIPLNAATLLAKHVTLELESIDRMYLHGYVPRLQSGAGVAHYFRKYRGQPFVSSALMAPINTAFIRAIERFVATRRIPVVTFARGERKEAVAAKHLARFRRREGV